MAGGEKAKSSGEYGEKIVKNLLELIGWTNCNEGVTVPCVYAEKHAQEGKTSCEKHGIDYVFQYKSPLRDATKQDVLISVKCRDGYPKTEQGIKNKFKEFLLDIAYAGECYPACDIANRKISNTNKKVVSSLIFWIDRNKGDNRENESVVDKINGFYLREDCTYDTVALIDNAQAQFLYTIINFAKNKYGKDSVEFFYLNTGLNNSNLMRQYTGSVLPFEYVNSSVVPMAITNEEQKTLLLVTKDNFCEGYLKRLIGLSQELTNAWAANIVIAFPDYNDFEHSENVTNSKSCFDDDSFVKKITVVSYNPDFRDEV